jgi:hypothetical protein
MGEGVSDEQGIPVSQVFASLLALKVPLVSADDRPDCLISRSDCLVSSFNCLVSSSDSPVSSCDCLVGSSDPLVDAKVFALKVPPLRRLLLEVWAQR